MAKKWLRERYGVTVRGYLPQLGDIEIAFVAWTRIAESNPFFAADRERVPELEAYMDELRAVGRLVSARGIDVSCATACRRAWASRSTTSSMPTSPRR